MDAFTELEKSVSAALETYSNVHRGSGHFSMATTSLFEKSREIVLDYLGLPRKKYVVIFCSKARKEALAGNLKPGSFIELSGNETGLPLGVRALAVMRNSIPVGAPYEAGGGTTILVSPNWVVWADAPGKFEAGTPAIVNIIAFARALQLMRRYGSEIFKMKDGSGADPEGILYRDRLEGFSGTSMLNELRKDLFGRELLVPAAGGQRPYINLDYGASTPALRIVFESFCKALRQPAGSYPVIAGEVKKICASFLGAPEKDYDFIFTSNTTEAVNLAASALSYGNDAGNVIINTILEHNSNDLPWRNRPGLTVERLITDREGFINSDDLTRALYQNDTKVPAGRVILVSVSGGSNVLGTCNDIARISSIVHNHGACLLVDAAQLVSHRRIEMDKCGIDCLVFSAHKAYAPFGTGVLVIKKNLSCFDYGRLDKNIASGEENIAGIAALGKALVLLSRTGMDTIMKGEHELTARAINGLNSVKGMKIHGINDPSSPGFPAKGGVISFSIKSVWPDKIASLLAEEGGIGIRYGCHCAHLLVKYLLNVPPGLQRLQGVMARTFRSIRFPGVARVSMGIGNTEEDISRLVSTLGDITSGKAKKDAWQRKETRKMIEEFVVSREAAVFGDVN